MTLTELRYAESDGRHFSLTPRVLRLGYAFLSSAPLPKLAQPVLEMVGERTQEVASIAILDGTEVLFVARCANRRIVSAMVGVGTRLPAYCTSTGRVLLASRPDAEIERYLKGISPRKLTPKTKVTARELMNEIANARKNGFAVSDEELELGLLSISVPVTDSRGQVVLAMSASLQSNRMTTANALRQLLPALKEGARTLSAML